MDGRTIKVIGILLAAAASASAQVTPPPAREIYFTRCAFCHGPDGRGDGPAGSSLQPPPTNFANAEYWKKATTESIKNVIANGKPQTAMVPFAATLTAAQIDELAVFLKSFAPAVETGPH